MTVQLEGSEARRFDSFECAIHAMAPVCPHCFTSVVGHGVETEDGAIYCCAHCAREHGHRGLADSQKSRN
jgi:hypothetical protein